MGVMVPDEEVLVPWAKHNGISGSFKQICTRQVCTVFMTIVRENKSLEYDLFLLKILQNKIVCKPIKKNKCNTPFYWNGLILCSIITSGFLDILLNTVVYSILAVVV